MLKYVTTQHVLAEQFKGSFEQITKYGLKSTKAKDEYRYYLKGKRIRLGDWIVRQEHTNKFQVVDNYMFKTLYRRVDDECT
ncbi:hypothetical protein L2520_03775 [Limosilactobacillus vaginalis]|uniref:Uncharacterized protein n=1 Tax=Limosilactobacillus vaginalis TaxID=1633 RepID=A0ABT4K6U0_9LACO|nr:hypothetical protein [Limosilactobacillus vaginalis]MCZ3746542.1 hypothetical protein [Limosilactobacillus vaginalis]MCZ3751566.1 hypothetical protein [Limosilactobacillus vaginalis]MCZ3753252.1 hypothetical protein [Limosilactobacillus vaginalis]MCZ3755062.1 hypothetical protein [Limosilactobacillus vaginalis]MCZ3756738.1 hypothetical protein [Limosilactobacillus vaginalis]